MDLPVVMEEPLLRNLASLAGFHDLDVVDEEEDDEIIEALRLRSRVDDIFAAQALFLTRAVERIVTSVAPMVRVVWVTVQLLIGCVVL